jgi:hypothetical protein
MVDHGHVEPGFTSGVRLGREVFIGAARPERVRGNQEHHALIMPDTLGERGAHAAGLAVWSTLVG